MRASRGSGLIKAAAWLACLLLLLAARPGEAAVPYANITAVDVKTLTNGVQVLVKADGILEYHSHSSEDGEYRSTFDRFTVRFTNARSKLDKTFIDVSQYPLSYVQISVPASAAAQEGVGIEMTLAMYEPSPVDVRGSEDGLSVILTVSSSRTLEEHKKVEEKAGEKESYSEVTYAEGLLTIKAVKAKIQDLLAEVARKSGLNVVVDDAVDHEVSLNLSGQKPEDVLQIIATAYGLALASVPARNGEGVVYMLTEGVPNDLATYHLSSTASFRLKHTQATTASSLLPTFLYNYLHVNSEQNAVVVTAPSQMLGKIQSDLQKIDLPPAQIMVEVLAVELSSTEREELGLNWRYRTHGYQVGADSGTGTATYYSGQMPDPETGELVSIGTLGREFYAKLQSLLEQGRARIHANPKMTTTNGRLAEIFIGTQRFIKVSYESYGVVQERIQMVDVGVRLRVTPWSGGNREVTMQIAPEVSNVVELDPKTGLPLLSTRQASTTVRVMDGETVAVGGLSQKQRYDTKTKIPVLGDLPLIGSLFRSSRTSSVDSELVIFVTPHIVDETKATPPGFSEELLQSLGVCPGAPGASLEQPQGETPSQPSPTEGEQ